MAKVLDVDETNVVKARRFVCLGCSAKDDDVIGKVSSTKTTRKCSRCGQKFDIMLVVQGIPSHVRTPGRKPSSSMNYSSNSSKLKEKRDA